MKDKQLAPVVLFTYNRPEHTQLVLDALAENYLATQSDLFIFCDGPKNDMAVKSNNLVRELIDKEQEAHRFRSVTVFKSSVNKGLAKSIIEGVTNVILKYGKCIVLEDDHITSQYFLTYQNEALNFYRDNKSIWSISGFTYDLKALEDYNHDVYLSYRACSHGWSTWVDRWVMVDWNVKDFERLSRSPAKIIHFNKGGNDLYRMLRHQVRGERDSWAIRFCYSQSKNNMLTVYPRVSLIKNIGFDGSGTHCQDSGNKIHCNFQKDISCLKLEKIELNNKITREFKLQYRVTFKETIEWIGRKVKKLKKGDKK